MEGTTIVAVVSVIISGVVGPLIASNAVNRRQREARAHAAQKRLQEQLSGAASLTAERWFAFAEVYRSWKSGLSPDSSEGKEAIQRFLRVRVELNALLGPLSISFGPESLIVSSFRDYLFLGSRFYTFIQEYEAGTPFSQGVDREFNEEIASSHQRLRDVFLEAAYEYLKDPPD